MNPHITRLTGRVMPVNSFLVDCGTGITVVDAQLCRSDAEAVRVAVEATGKPLLGVLITHPHPDHYAGAGIVTASTDAPIYATAAVTTVIGADDDLKNTIVGAMMGDEWPSERRFPNAEVADGETVVLGQQEFTVTAWGPGESHADTTWALSDRTVFAGDLVYHDEHAYLADGHSRDWLATLERFERSLHPETMLYAGHGGPAGPELVSQQRRYVETFLTALEEAIDLDPAERERRVLDAVRPLASTEDLLFLTQLSIEPAVAAMSHAGP